MRRCEGRAQAGSPLPSLGGERGAESRGRPGCWRAPRVPIGCGPCGGGQRAAPGVDWPPPPSVCAGVRIWGAEGACQAGGRERRLAPGRVTSPVSFWEPSGGDHVSQLALPVRLWSRGPAALPALGSLSQTAWSLVPVQGDPAGRLGGIDSRAPSPLAPVLGGIPTPWLSGLSAGCGPRSPSPHECRGYAGPSPLSFHSSAGWEN